MRQIWWRPALLGHSAREQARPSMCGISLRLWPLLPTGTKSVRLRSYPLEPCFGRGQKTEVGDK